MTSASDLKMYKAVTALFLGSFHSKSYEIKREGLTLAFENLHLFPKESVIKQILKDILHKSLLYGEQTKDELYLRRHKAFVMRYISGMTYQEIGDKLNVNIRTITRDIEAFLDKAMIFTYGIDGIMPEGVAEKTAAGRKRKEKPTVTKIENTSLESYAVSQVQKRKKFIEIAEQIMPELGVAVSKNEYSKCHFILEKYFSNYNQLRPNDPMKEVLDTLLVLHNNYADYSRNENIIKRYQIFEMKYIKRLDNSNIARLAKINLYSLYLECREAIKDMLFIAFGVKSSEDESRIYGQRG